MIEEKINQEVIYENHRYVLPSLKLSYRNGTVDFTTQDVILETSGETTAEAMESMKLLLCEAKKLIVQGGK